MESHGKMLAEIARPATAPAVRQATLLILLTASIILVMLKVRSPSVWVDAFLILGMAWIALLLVLL